MLFHLLLLFCCIVSVTPLHSIRKNVQAQAQAHNNKKISMDNAIVAAIDNAETATWEIKWPASKIGPPSAAIVQSRGAGGNRRPKKAKLMLLQTDMETQGQAQAQAQAQQRSAQAVYPAIPPVKIANPGVAASQSPQQARTTIRGGNNDAAGLGANIGLYTFDLRERVTRAFFTIGASAASAPSVEAEEWCDVSWNHLGTAGNWYHRGGAESRARPLYNTGHIIAASFGGPNDDPANFFPQHFMSNSYGGRWRRAEQIAAAVKTRVGAANVVIDISLMYTDSLGAVVPAALAGRDFVPIGGDFTIIVDGPTWVASFGPGAMSAMADVFRRNAYQTAMIPTPADPWEVTYTWTNTPEAVIGALPPGGTHPNYIVEPTMF